MGEGAAAVCRRLHETGVLDGVLGMGGSGNTSIATAAMRALPYGVPKLMVSTMASGDVEPYVGARDVMLLYSVADVEGINRLSRLVLSNAALAMAGMVGGERPDVDDGRTTVGITMFGVTTPCVRAARDYLEDRGYETIVFHATGTGGRAMEGSSSTRPAPAGAPWRRSSRRGSSTRCSTSRPRSGPTNSSVASSRPGPTAWRPPATGGSHRSSPWGRWTW